MLWTKQNGVIFLGLLLAFLSPNAFSTDCARQLERLVQALEPIHFDISSDLQPLRNDLLDAFPFVQGKGQSESTPIIPSTLTSPQRSVIDSLNVWSNQLTRALNAVSRQKSKPLVDLHSIEIDRANGLPMVPGLHTHRHRPKEAYIGTAGIARDSTVYRHRGYLTKPPEYTMVILPGLARVSSVDLIEHGTADNGNRGALIAVEWRLRSTASDPSDPEPSYRPLSYYLKTNPFAPATYRINMKSFFDEP